MPIDATSYLSSSAVNYASDGAARVPQKTLNQDDFLKLLITQMTSQDPMNPKSDMDMAAQMAQFTSLEQSRTMASNMGTLIDDQQVLNANSLIGRKVQVQVDSSTSVTGTVGAVDLSTGTPMILVNGKAYPLGQVTGISEPEITPASKPLVNPTPKVIQYQNQEFPVNP